MQTFSLTPEPGQHGCIHGLPETGDTFMGLDLAHGGHLTHGSPVNVSGIWYNAISYQLNEEPDWLIMTRWRERLLNTSLS